MTTFAHPDIVVGSRWQQKSNADRIATVIIVREGYLRFRGPWLKGGESGKAMDAFLAHYLPADDAAQFGAAP